MCVRTCVYVCVHAYACAFVCGGGGRGVGGSLCVPKKAKKKRAQVRHLFHKCGFCNYFLKPFVEFKKSANFWFWGGICFVMR